MITLTLDFVDRAVVLLAVGSTLFVEATGSLLVGEVDLSLETGTASIKASQGIQKPVWVESCFGSTRFRSKQVTIRLKLTCLGAWRVLYSSFDYYQWKFSILISSGVGLGESKGRLMDKLIRRVLLGFNLLFSV